MKASLFLQQCEKVRTFNAADLSKVADDLFGKLL